MGENMQLYILIFSYIKDKSQNIFLYFLFEFVFLIIFLVYGLPVGIFLYTSLICFSIWILLLAYGFYKYYIKHKNLRKLENNITAVVENLPNPKGLIEKDYQNLLYLLNQEKRMINLEAEERHKDLLEYYTLWTHQIKTPLSAIDLLIQTGEGRNEELELQVFEVEKYVDMALQYLRIDSMTSDLRFEKYSIKKIVKKAIKKYSKIFIYKGISLDLGDGDIKVITDEKWLLFVIKQILSNSLKYTDKGKVSIYVKGENLIIKDTGIGIRQEDIPRIFERGFTGYSGRVDEKSTGLGLYLSKKILDNLGHEIKVSSKDGEGTRVEINLSSQKLEIE